MYNSIGFFVSIRHFKHVRACLSLSGVPVHYLNYIALKRLKTARYLLPII